MRRPFHSRPHGTLATSIVPLTLFTAALLAAGARPGSAQTFSANLAGVVTDDQQARVPGVTVVIENQATGERREHVTGPDGRYIFSQLLPGRYDVTAEIGGFKRFRQVDLPLRANQAAELNITMQVGGLAEELVVTAPQVVLDTRSANQAVTLTSQMITELPINTRTPFALVLGLAGTTALSARNFSSDNLDQQFSRFALNGGRDMSNLVLIDGAPATAGDWGGLIVSPSPESVQEMQIARNTYDAEFGRSGGGVVNVVTRGGSSQFRGGAWEYYRTDELDANSWANNRAGRKKTNFSRHQFGGTAGGPLWPSRRVFFFGSYEGLRQSFPFETGFQRVPTELERRGDFSQTRNPDGSLAVIYNPFTTRPNPANPGQFIRDPFPGNRIPPELIDPVAAAVLQLYPLPNRDGNPVTNADNFFASDTGTNVRDAFDVRVDWARSEKHNFYGRVSAAPRSGSIPPAIIGNGVETAPIQRNPRVHATISNTFFPTDNWVVNVLLGGGYWKEEQRSRSFGVSDASRIGLPTELFHAPLIPQFNVAGYMTLGNPQLRGFPRATYSLQANATRHMGAHSLRFGFWGESNLVNNVDRFTGRFNFGRGITSGPIAANDSTSTGNALASLLLGTGAGGDSQFRADMAASLRYYAGYVQDVWTVNDRLTVNAGVRYEIQRPATERFNRIAWFDPEVPHPLADVVGLPLKGGYRFASADDRGQWKQDWNDIAPRIGAAYKWTDQLVMRAGYGIFYGAASALYTFDPVPGVSVSTPWIAANGFIPADLLRNPYPQGTVRATGTSAGLDTLVGFGEGQSWLREPHPTPYKHQYSIDLQYQLDPVTVVEIGYSGFQGRNLVFGNPSHFNQLHPDFLALGPALDQQVPNPFFGRITAGALRFPTVPRQRLLRPFPHFDHIGLTRSLTGAEASFNALNLRFSRAFSGGLAVIATYQYSKNTDNASEDQGWAINDQWRDTFNKDLERSVSAHDVPHSFATSLLYELPFGRERRFAGNMPAAADAVLGGWQVSAIVRLASGFPAPIRAPNPLGAYGFQVARPHLVGDPEEVSDRRPQTWFNPAAFANPDPFTIGTAPRYLSNLREAPIRNVDLAIAKKFLVRRYTVDFRGEMLNAFNHPQFGGLNTTLGAATFGQATAVVNTPRNVQLGLRVTF
jgi:outer membrane receptor protein involved in Fe transport